MPSNDSPRQADEASAPAAPPSATAPGSATDAPPPPALDAPAAPAAPDAPAPVAAQTAAADCGPRLKQLFPALFAGTPKPLKLRIQVDIRERAPGAFTRQALSAFLRRHTGSTSYLQAVAQGKQRFDLDGRPSGDVAEEHRQVARDELARRRASHEERRALEDQQRRNRAGLLHDYERTTLTRANFCALKQVAEEELDGLLAIAREEAALLRGPGSLRGAEPRAPGHGHGAEQRGPRNPTPGRRRRARGEPERRHRTRA